MADPPRDIAAEEAILGAILRTAQHDPTAAVVLVDAAPEPVDFYDSRHGTLMAHLRAAAEAGDPLEPAAMLGRLMDAGDLRQQHLDGPRLLELVQRAAANGAVEFYAERVRTAAKLRRAQAAVAKATTRLNAVQDLDDVDAALYEAMADLEDETGGQAQMAGVRSPITFRSLAELRAKVRKDGPRRFLLRGVWPQGDYGVHSIEQKGGKTWNTVDFAVSAASGTPWLGTVPVDLSGPVVMFAGEGSEANLVRRIEAVCESRGLDPDALPITICARSPHLADETHRRLMREKIAEVRPVLVTLDPFYLAVPGAKGGSLYDMGAVLEHAQHICQDVGAALLVVTHHNRNKSASGAGRITGAGPAEWGRVLITGDVVSRRLDPDTRMTTAVTVLDVIGGEVPGGKWRVTRKVWTDDPDDLDSPMHYQVEAREEVEDDTPPGWAPARWKILQALRTAPGPLTVVQIGDWIATTYAIGLKRNTISQHLNALAEDGLADQIDHGKGKQKEWIATDRQGVS